MPILAGATFRDRALASTAAVVGIASTAWVARLLGLGGALPMLVAPMGASAVLSFAVPSSPLAQPWSIVGGNVVSACVGVTAARFIHDPVLAAGLAVGGAIFAMSMLRCLHPPGGAAALTAVIGGPAVLSAAYLFPFVPVGLNSLALLSAGWLFHRFSGHAYPHRVPAPAVDAGFHASSIDRALADLGESFDIRREDLDELLRRAETYERERRAPRSSQKPSAPPKRTAA